MKSPIIYASVLSLAFSLVHGGVASANLVQESGSNRLHGIIEDSKEKNIHPRGDIVEYGIYYGQDLEDEIDEIPKPNIPPPIADDYHLPISAALKAEVEPSADDRPPDTEQPPLASKEVDPPIQSRVKLDSDTATTYSERARPYSDRDPPYSDRDPPYSAKSPVNPNPTDNLPKLEKGMVGSPHQFFENGAFSSGPGKAPESAPGPFTSPVPLETLPENLGVQNQRTPGSLPQENYSSPQNPLPSGGHPSSLEPPVSGYSSLSENPSAHGFSPAGNTNYPPQDASPKFENGPPPGNSFASETSPPLDIPSRSENSSQLGIPPIPPNSSLPENSRESGNTSSELNPPKPDNPPPHQSEEENHPEAKYHPATEQIPPAEQVPTETSQKPGRTTRPPRKPTPRGPPRKPILFPSIPNIPFVPFPAHKFQIPIVPFPAHKPFPIPNLPFPAQKPFPIPNLPFPAKPFPTPPNIFDPTKLWRVPKQLFRQIITPPKIARAIGHPTYPKLIRYGGVPNEPSSINRIDGRIRNQVSRNSSLPRPIISEEASHEVSTNSTRQAQSSRSPSKWLSDDFIININKEQDRWKAGRNFRSDLTDDQLSLLVARDPARPERTIMNVLVDIYASLAPNLSSMLLEYIGFTTDEWDGRRSWCEGGPQDTGWAATSWALSSAAALRERMCMLRGISSPISYSAEYVIDCCKNCEKEKYKGGGAYMAYQFFRQTGAPSEKCQPYRNQKISLKPENLDSIMLPKPRACVKACDNGEPFPPENNQTKFIHKAEEVFFVTPAWPSVIRREIMRGAVTAEVTVYTDFLNYKKGVYCPTKAAIPFGNITVRLIGWGTENGHHFWQAAGIWGPEFGEKGYVKFEQFSTKLNLESRVTAARPLLEEPLPMA